jgi:hypothetical protein
MLVGILAIGLAGGFLVWRAQHARTAALAAASQASGIRRAGGSAANTVRRMAGAVAVVIVGLAVAVPVSATALAPDSRHALSDTVDPVPELSRYVSPLVSYRTAFEPGAYSAPLLSYSGDADAVGRLRIATLSFYDGQNFEVLNSDSDRSHDFQHLPSLIGTGRSSTGLATLGVTIGDYRKLGMPDVWMPTAANLRAISFAGADANALTDRFYFNPQLQAAAQLRPLDAGDSYTMLVQPPAAAPALATLQPPAGALPSTDHVPAGLTKWVQDQGVGGGGAGLAKLIDRLRARGYLSHSLVAPTGSGTWLTDLAAADSVPAANAAGLFEQSLAGESMDRIGAMFDALEQVQNAASKQASDKDLVAAVGDDEQFAVASALIAESLGFPARVVLGFVLDPGMTDGSPIPACDTASKTCAGKNLTAWIEVKTGGAGWVPITTSPQARDKKVTKNTATKDPTIVTQVQPRGATVQPPPEANPTGGTDPSNQHTPTSQPAAATWLPAFRLAGQIGTVLLVLLAPFLALVIVKLARRRERRRLADTAARMAAGWDELVDTAVDLGLPGQGIRTRTEAAALYAAAARTADPVQLRTLASGADEAVFGAFDPTPAEAEQYWAHLDEQRSRLAAGFPRWKRLRALVSLRSFGTRGGGRS